MSGIGAAILAAILASGGAWLYAKLPKPPTVTTFTDGRGGRG